MNTTQIIFKIDQKTKDRAMQKARKEGTTLSAFLKSATSAYVRDEYRNGIVRTRDAEQAKRHPEIDVAIEEGLRDFREGRVTPVFRNAKEFNAYRKTKEYKKLIA